MKICDVHVHIYPDAIAEKASASIGDFYPGYRIHGNGSLTDCMRRMDEADIDCFCAHSVALSPRVVPRINDFIYEAKRKNPSRILAFGAIHPAMEEFDDALSRLVDRGFKGLKIHPDMMRFNVDADEAMPMMEAIAKNGRLPLLIHCGDTRYDFDRPERILRLHERFPEMKLICAHLGGWMMWDEAVDILAGQDLMFDCSSALFHFEPEEAARVIRRLGTKKVFFGSDYPMWNPGDELKRFLTLPLTQEEREDICWNNFMGLMGESGR